MFRGAHVALFAVLTASSVNAFSPVFSTPRQCDTLKITWSSMDPAALSLTEFTMSLVPLESTTHIVPEPYTLTVPCNLDGGEIEVPTLPFKAGTQFFASAYIPGHSGPVRRTVSPILTVEESANSSCLRAAALPKGRSRAKVFGKRQIDVVGATTVGADELAAAAPSGEAPPPINVIGVGVIPSDSAAGGEVTPTADPSSSTVSSSADAASTTGPIPPIRVIGESQIPTSGNGADTPPANAVPAPAASSSGPAPPINVIGTYLLPADGSAVPPTESSEAAAPTESDSAPSDPYAAPGDPYAAPTDVYPVPTETPTDTTEAALPTIVTTSIALPGQVEEQGNIGYDAVESQPCEDGTASGVDNPYGAVPTETTTSTRTFNTEVVQYGSFEDMVNAANSMFHAWNPYGPSYTPSA